MGGGGGVSKGGFGGVNWVIMVCLCVFCGGGMVWFIGENGLGDSKIIIIAECLGWELVE